METIADIRADVDSAFCYDETAKYQTRAHEYLTEHRINRGYNDTAVQCVVRDLVLRAYDAGKRDALDEMDDVPALAATCLSAAGELATIGCRLRGIKVG